jgi:hypothetical protein
MSSDSTGATTVLPVVHIARRKRWEDVAAAEKDLSDDEPVTTPIANHSGSHLPSSSSNSHH